MSPDEFFKKLEEAGTIWSFTVNSNGEIRSKGYGINYCPLQVVAIMEGYSFPTARPSGLAQMLDLPEIFAMKVASAADHRISYSGFREQLLRACGISVNS